MTATDGENALYKADLDIIEFCREKGYPVRTHPFFRDVEKFWPFVLCELPGGAVVGPHPTPVCEGIGFFDSLSNFGPAQKRRMAALGNIERTVVNVEKAVLIAGNPSFGHFLDVHLLQTLYLQLFEELRDLPIITRSDMPRGSFDLLELMNCPPERIIKIDDTQAIVCETLYVPTTVGGVSPDRRTYSAPGKLCRLFRETATNAFIRETVTPFRKLYVRRGDVKTKGLINLEEVETFMEEMGYELVDPSRHSLADQVQMAHETTHFVSISGSQIHLANYAQPGASVLMMAYDEQRNNPTWDGMERFGHMGIDYGFMLFECDEAGNLKVDVDRLRQGMESAGFPTGGTAP